MAARGHKEINIKENKNALPINEINLTKFNDAILLSNLPNGAKPMTDIISGVPVDQVAQTKQLASIACEERIVFCVDISLEMNKKRYRAKAGRSYSGLELVKRALKLFICNKQSISSPQFKHKFALAVLLDEALWVADFTSDIEELLTHIERLQALESTNDTFNLSTMFDMLMDKNLIMSSPCFFIDVIYLNEPPSVSNMSQDIFEEFCELDHRASSYVCDVSRTPTKVFDAFATLLAHPLQRAIQSKSGYKLEPNLEDIDDGYA